MKKATESGTSHDRMAALALRVESSPMFQLDALASLISLAKKHEARIVEQAIVTLRDLFLNILPDRKLK